MKTVLIVVANNWFQDYEFSTTYEALQRDNSQITIAAWRKWVCVWVFGLRVDAVYSLHEVHWDKFEMVVYIGWWGALTQYLHDNEYLRIAQEAKKVWAICIAPMVLSESWIFNGKTVTSWNDEWLQKSFIEWFGWSRKDEPVIRCWNVVTANWPEAAEDFWLECVKLLNDETLY